MIEEKEDIDLTPYHKGRIEEREDQIGTPLQRKVMAGQAINSSAIPSDIVPPSILPAFLRALGRGTFEAGANAADLIPALKKAQFIHGALTGDKVSYNLPEFLKETSRDQAHPFAELLGTGAGYGIPGLGEAKAAEALFPPLGRFAAKSATSFLRRLMLNTGEGALGGYTLSPEGERGKGTLIGGAVGPAAGEALSFVKNLPSMMKGLFNASNKQELESSLSEAVQSNFLSREGLQDFHDQALTNQNLTDKALRQHLGEGTSHEVELANHLNNFYETNVQKGKDIFSQLESSLDKRTISMPDSSIMGTKEVNLKDLFNNYRNLRDVAGEMWSDTTNPLLKTGERKELIEQAKQAQAQAEELKAGVEKHMTPDEKKLLNQGNDLYKDVIYPLRASSIFKKVQKEGVTPNDLLFKLTGPEEHPVLDKDLTSQMKAKKIMRDFIQSSPETSRLLIGQKYASRPELLHEPNAELQPYLEASPQTNVLAQSHKNALDRKDATQEALKQSIANEGRVGKGLPVRNFESENLGKSEDLKTLLQKSNLSAKDKTELARKLKEANATRDKVMDLVKAGTITGATYSIVQKLLGDRS